MRVLQKVWWIELIRRRCQWGSHLSSCTSTCCELADPKHLVLISKPVSQHTILPGSQPELSPQHVLTVSLCCCCGMLYCAVCAVQVKPHVDHTWVKIGNTEDEVDDVVLSTVQGDPDYKAGKARVLVFAANTANADRVSGGCSAQCRGGTWCPQLCVITWLTNSIPLAHGMLLGQAISAAQVVLLTGTRPFRVP